MVCSTAKLNWSHEIRLKCSGSTSPRGALKGLVRQLVDPVACAWSQGTAGPAT